MAQMLKYEIHHTTAYQYEEEIESCVMSVCMQPRDHRQQVVRSFFIRTSPQASFSVEFDAFGNRHHYFDIHHPHDRLEISVSAVIEHAVPDHNLAQLPAAVDSWAQLAELQTDWDMWDFLRSTELTSVSRELRSWLTNYPVDSDADPYTRLKTLTKHMFDTFQYVPGSTHVDSTIDHFLATKEGVCQDYAHLMIAVARTWGIPARYVSGYLYDQDEKNVRADNATHAWVECWLPGLGWMPFDPTNNKVDDENLVTVALGRDYRDVAPSRGITIGGGGSELDVGVTVSREVTETQTQGVERQNQQ